jgi:hypothetical protein
MNREREREIELSSFVRMFEEYMPRLLIYFSHRVSDSF